MFDRKSIKEFARYRLSQRRWVVIIVLVIAGLLGGAVATPTVPSLSFSGSLPTESIFSEDYTDDSTDTGTVWDDAQPYDPEEDGADPDQWGSMPDADDSVPGTADPGIWDDAGAEEERSWEDVWNEFLESFEYPAMGWGVAAFLVIFGVVLLVAVVFAALKTIFLGNVVTVGMNGWLLRFWRGEYVSVLDLFACFRIYKPSLKAMLVRDIYFILWNMLPVVGIIKSYAYSLVPYIIYENPNLTPNQAITLSRKLTHGYKWQLFVLELSFIGWGLLSALTLGIVGVLYVNPYMGLSYAGAYEQIKWAALQDGRATWADFGQMPPADMWDVPAEPIVAEPIPVESVEDNEDTQ